MCVSTSQALATGREEVELAIANRLQGLPRSHRDFVSESERTKSACFDVANQVVLQAGGDVGPTRIEKCVQRALAVVNDVAVLDSDQAQAICQRDAELHREQLGITTSRNVCWAECARESLVDEHRPDFGQVAWVLEVNEVDHRADEVVETTIAWLNEPEQVQITQAPALQSAFSAESAGVTFIQAVAACVIQAKGRRITARRIAAACADVAEKVAIRFCRLCAAHCDRDAGNDRVGDFFHFGSLRENWLRGQLPSPTERSVSLLHGSTKHGGRFAKAVRLPMTSNFVTESRYRHVARTRSIE